MSKDWHPNSNKHKREHGGYKNKPSRKQVNALLDFYALVGPTPLGNIVNDSYKINSEQLLDKQDVNVQMKLF